MDGSVQVKDLKVELLGEVRVKVFRGAVLLSCLARCELLLDLRNL